MAIQRASPDARELADRIKRDVRVIGERLIGDGQDPLTVEACVGAHGDGMVRGNDPPCPSRRSAKFPDNVPNTGEVSGTDSHRTPGDHTCIHRPRSWLPRPFRSPPAPPPNGYSSASTRPLDVPLARGPGGAHRRA